MAVFNPFQMTGAESQKKFSILRSVTSIHFLVTVGTVNTGALCLMTAYATFHGDITLAIKLLALFDLTVTLGAGGACRQMGAMAEPDIAGDLVDARPFHFALVSGKRRQFLDCRFISADV